MPIEIEGQEHAFLGDDGKIKCNAELPLVDPIDSDTSVEPHLYYIERRKIPFNCIHNTPTCATCPVAHNHNTVKEGYYTIPSQNIIKGPTITKNPLIEYKKKDKHPRPPSIPGHRSGIGRG